MIGTVPLGIDAAIVLGFVVVAVLGFRDRDNPGAIPFVVLAGLLATMAVGVALGRSGVLPDPWTGYGLFVPFVFASLAWVALAFDYTGRGPVITRRVAGGLAAFGVVVVVITALNAVVPDSVLPIWFLLINVVQVGLIAAVGFGAVLIARSAIDYGDLPRSGGLVLAAVGASLVIVTVVQSLSSVLSNETVFSIVEGILGVIAVLLLFVYVRYGVFETSASAGHLARESVLDEMSVAVAITGLQDRLLDVNRTAQRTFDIELPEELGDPVEDVLGFDPNQSAAQPIPAETSQGRREFELERSELTAQGSDPIGRAYMLRDVTERRTHEQRLDVLNRVLRHNLRNDLDAIRGFAETLERPDATVENDALARQIQTTATDVADLGTTVSEAEQLLNADGLALEPVDVGAVLHELTERVGDEHPRASIAVTTADQSTTLRTDRRVFETVLRETVENGIEHNDTTSPRVELAVERRDDGVRIEVRDDGPGIPERERAVLLEGEERPLRHGSGLGLWLVYWGVTRLGGTLAFRERAPRGSVVSIRVPNRTEHPDVSNSQ